MDLQIDSNLFLRRNVVLSQYTTMQVGGPAKYFVQPNTEEQLKLAVQYAKEHALRYVILGKGSNTVFADSGFDGLVISMIRFEETRIDFDIENRKVYAGSGVFLYKLALSCCDAGLSGVEFLASIPGTVGGAVMMNAGYSRYVGQKNEIADILQNVHVLDGQLNRRIIPKSECRFAYRNSNLQGNIILGTELQLWKRSSEFIEHEIRENFEYRNREQDLKHPSSGSIFKNPLAPAPSAGILIDRCGLKGFRIGNAMVSNVHGNYIINAGGASASDIIQLIQEVKSKVFNEYKVSLETEVKVIE